LKHFWVAILLLVVSFGGSRAAARDDAKIRFDGRRRNAVFQSGGDACPGRCHRHHCAARHQLWCNDDLPVQCRCRNCCAGLRFPRTAFWRQWQAMGSQPSCPWILVNNNDPAKAIAYIAVEDPARPWPKIPGKQVSAGPFYLVWVDKEAGSIRSETWPYQLAHLRVQTAPARRWPALAVDATLPATDPIPRWAGSLRYGVPRLPSAQSRGQCGGWARSQLANESDRVFQPAALHRYIRDPASVRHWPGQKMPGFGPEQLSDREIDLIIAYPRPYGRAQNQIEGRCSSHIHAPGSIDQTDHAGSLEVDVERDGTWLGGYSNWRSI